MLLLSQDPLSAGIDGASLKNLIMLAISIIMCSCVLSRNRSGKRAIPDINFLAPEELVLEILELLTHFWKYGSCFPIMIQYLRAGLSSVRIVIYLDCGDVGKAQQS